MKTLALAAITLAVLPRAFALFGVGDVVYDPVNNGVLVETKVETLAQWASALAKAETQIQNQLQQIQRADSLLTTQNQIKLGIGDWQSVVTKAQSIQLQAQNLTKDNNQGISASFVVTTGQPTLGYTNHGNFDAVPTTDAFGNPVTVSDDSLKRYAAVEAVYEKALTTLSRPSIYRLMARRVLIPIPGLRNKRLPKKQVRRLADGNPSLSQQL